MGRTVRTLLGTGSVYRRTNRAGVELPIWHVQYSVRTSTGPKQVRESAHTTDRDVALELLKQKLGEVAGGRAPDPNRKHITVKALLAELAAAYKQEKRGSWPNVESAAKIFNDAIGDVRALDVTTHMLHRLVGEWRGQGMTAATCNRRIQILRTAYNFADLLVDPARLKFKKALLKEKSPRAKYIDRQAFAAIHKHLDDDLKDLFEMSYLLGKRRGQLLSTKWSNVDRSSWTVTWEADTTKTGETETLTLAGRPLAIMKARWKSRRLDTDLVFHRNGRPIVDVRDAWERACTAAGFPVGRKNGGYEWRATRHSAVTNLLNVGTPVHEAMLVSGHKSASVVKRYSLAVREQQVKALEAVSRLHPNGRRHEARA